MSNAIDALQDPNNHEDNSAFLPSQVFAHAREIASTVKNNRGPRETAHCMPSQADEGIFPFQSADFIPGVTYDQKHLQVCNGFVEQHGELILEFKGAYAAWRYSSDISVNQLPSLAWE